MYGNLHRELALSGKHAKCSIFANLVWDRLLAFAVPDGRFSADPALVKASAFPLFAVRLYQIEKAIAELVAVGLLHRYDVDGKAVLLYHDWQEWGPRLKSARSAYPPPPPSLCRCCAERSEKGARPPSPLLSSQAPERQGPTENDPIQETLRARVARAYQAVNGGTADPDKIAAHFVQLEHASLAADADWLVQRAGAGDMLGRKPWEAAERLRIAWTEERARRATEADAAKRAAAPPPADDLGDPEVRRRAVQARAQAVRRGAFPIGAVEADLRDEVRRLVQEGA